MKRKSIPPEPVDRPGGRSSSQLPLRFLIVDDHAVVRHGLRQILADAHPTAVFGETDAAQRALEMVWKEPWDLVLLDLSMPGRSGLDVLKELKESRPTMPVLMLSMYSEDQFALRALRAGASGYLTKDSAPADLCRAVEKALAGGKFVSEQLAEKMACLLGTDPSRPPHEALSDREFQVLRAIASGRSVKEIAGDLSLSVKTVSTYRARIMEKMQLRTNAELMRYALHHGLVD